MAILKDILYKTSLIATSGDMNVNIESICFDSREANKDSLFVAVKGTKVDGHDYIESTIKAGAIAIVCEVLPKKLAKNVTYITVDNSTKVLGIIAANFYKNPSQSLKLVAVTGTNGKTTTATLLFQLFRRLGYNTGLLSTVENYTRCYRN
jgi:UDP-N-acetylmuramoyl-L-alanyl-D-glutamate--2,6-diaminopimelate ligase